MMMFVSLSTSHHSQSGRPSEGFSVALVIRDAHCEPLRGALQKEHIQHSASAQFKGLLKVIMYISLNSDAIFVHR